MKAAGTQSDRNMNFDGMESMSPSRSSKHMTNQWSGHMNDGRLVQKAQAPNRTGNDGSCDVPRNLAGSVTGDSNRRPMTAATPKLPAQGSIRDSINRGSQVRNPGGTVMPKRPSNPDSIRVGQSGGPGYGAVSKGTKPTTAAGQNDFNYGPKKQY
jgi:hypothetical protein